jgi:acid phosphatase class B|tara:strand:+ start:4002 stop:4310 length:309 start_codon:yes stop_codon:yes gene_type:complete
MKRIIAVDFDGVIHKFRKGWMDGSIYDEPVEDAIKELNMLNKKGYKVVVLTARTEHKEIQEWLKDKGVNFDIEVTNVKPPAIAYIDDRAIRFTNWNDIYKYF